MSKHRKSNREKDLTSRYFSGDMDDDRIEARQQFTARSKASQQNRMEKTAAMRESELPAEEIDRLALGEVIQVHSLYCQVLSEGVTHLCTTRKTLSKLSDTSIVVGDWVRFRSLPDRQAADPALPAAIIEKALPRKTVLTRADSFKGMVQHPIVANAGQMLIVASLLLPAVKWGLIDRMLVAAESGGLTPIVCLNKVDLADDPKHDKVRAEADEAMAHYQTLGIRVLRTSAERGLGIDELRGILTNQVTVLAGHSGVGKSSLIRAVQSDLDIRIGEISGYTLKGRHTTTSARRYPLLIGGAVVDTPGVKLFGLWGVNASNLKDFFPDVDQDTAPKWRRESFDRIRKSLAG